MKRMMRSSGIASEQTIRILPNIVRPAPALTVPLSAPGVAHAHFPSAVSLVEVYATVTDALGQPIAGLTAADFHVSEDGVPQTISTFAFGEFPLSVVVALDR